VKFDEAVEIILVHEGGYVFDAQDSGGETRYGISKRSFPKLDIKNLTKEKAKELYRSCYWHSVRADRLPSSLRLMVFDCAVNQGVSLASKILQRVVGVQADGIIGPVTIGACHGISDMNLIDEYASMRLAHYQNLPHWSRFGKGWSKRLLEVSLTCAFFAELPKELS